MFQNIHIDNKLVTLDSEKTIMLTDEPDAEEVLFRKALGLPSKKSIIYYKSPSKPYSAIKVISVRIAEMYMITYRWYTLELLLADGSITNVHSDYLSEMQKPDFFQIDAPADIRQYPNNGVVTAKMLSLSSLSKFRKDRFVAFDTETTGLSASKDRIIEIGAVIFENGVAIERFSSLINPGVIISPAASAVNHITQEMILSAPSEDEVFKSFLRFIGSASDEKVIMCAHNADFDKRFLVATFIRLGLNARFVFADTCSMSKKVFPSLENYKLQTVAEYCDLTNENAHRAISDAEICGQIFISILHKLNGVK